MLKDDTGRKRQNLFGAQAKSLCDKRTAAVCVLQAKFSRARVGASRIDHEGTNRLGLRDVLSADEHRRGTERILGKHAGHSGAGREGHDQQVFALGLTDTRFGHG